MYNKKAQPRQPSDLMNDNMLVKHYAGSIAYGTNLPSSDVDFRGVFCCDPVNIRTPFFPIREVTDASEEDTKFYELSHFFKLCLECNPNIIETLWVDPKHITHVTPAYLMLRDHRYSLLSSKIAFTTSGYALAQLKRIKGHNKWLAQEQRGVEKIRAALDAGEVTLEDLEKHFSEDVIKKITTKPNNC